MSYREMNADELGDFFFNWPDFDIATITDEEIETVLASGDEFAKSEQEAMFDWTVARALFVARREDESDYYYVMLKDALAAADTPKAFADAAASLENLYLLGICVEGYPVFPYYKDSLLYSLAAKFSLAVKVKSDLPTADEPITLACLEDGPMSFNDIKARILD